MKISVHTPILSHKHGQTHSTAIIAHIPHWENSLQPFGWSQPSCPLLHTDALFTPTQWPPSTFPAETVKNDNNANQATFYARCCQDRNPPVRLDSSREVRGRKRQASPGSRGRVRPHLSPEVGGRRKNPTASTGMFSAGTHPNPHPLGGRGPG